MKSSATRSGAGQFAGSSGLRCAAPEDDAKSGSTDVFTPEQRSAVMRKVPGKHSSAELAVRRLLSAMGVGYRLHRKDLPGSPDLAMAGRRLAVFVHGCFWHGHDCRRGARMPKANAGYWSAKIARNRARDAASAAALEAMGWRPVAVWECELKDEAALKARLADILAAAPRQGRATTSRTG